MDGQKPNTSKQKRKFGSKMSTTTTHETHTIEKSACYHCGQLFQYSSLHSHQGRCPKNQFRRVSRGGGRKKKNVSATSSQSTCTSTTQCFMDSTDPLDCTCVDNDDVDDNDVIQHDSPVALTETDELLELSGKFSHCIVNSSDLRRLPYETPFDKLMASYSIQHKCYGVHLNGVYTLLQQIQNTKQSQQLIIPAFAARNADELARMEHNQLHPGLVFDRVKLEVPLLEGTSNMFRSSVKDAYLTIRKDIGIAIVEMLTREGVWENLHWHYEEKSRDGIREYKGFYTANAWKELQTKMGYTTEIAGLLIFSDATEILRFSKSSLHPVYICPAGLDFEHMRLKSMTLVGFIPTDTRDIKDTLSSADQEDFSHWSRCMIATAYSLIVTRIHQLSKSGGIEFMHTGILHRVFPYVITSISDHLEGNNIAMMETLACRYCTVHKTDYSDASNDQLHLKNERSINTVQQELARLPDKTKNKSESGVDNQANPLWENHIRPFDPYMNAHCIFHDIDEGVWKWFLENILIPVFKSHTQQQQLMDEISCLTRVPGLKVWSKITTDTLRNLSAKELRHLLVEVVAVLAALLFRDETCDKMFIAVLDLCNWYELVRSKETSETDLIQMDTLTLKLRRSLRGASIDVTGEYQTNALKHHVILHYPTLIRQFGAMLFQSCEKWDSAHRFIIKAHLTSYGSDDFQSIVQDRASEL